MKKKTIYMILGIFAALVLLAMGYLYYNSTRSPAATAKFNENGLAIEVAYCQPKKKGREIFGKLVPFGKIWRTGANAATKITFGQDVQVGDKKVKKGTYSLFTIPQKDKWTVILNSTAEQWGAFFYEEAKDVMRTEVTAQAGKTETETFTMSFAKAEKGANLVLAWDKTEVIVPITLP
jgi:Protein of unknown function (DUF2911)